MLEKQFLSFQTVSLDIENLRVDFCHQHPPSYYTFNYKDCDVLPDSLKI